MKNFWQKFKKPILALAPMAGITDASFRYLCGKHGADVVYSEMISAAGLFYDSERTGGLLNSYRKNGGAKFVVQLFGNNPDHFAKAVKIIEKTAKPDGIDINFGCPVPKVRKVGAGVKLFQDLDQSRRVLEACLRNTKLPISVKTRISVPAANKINPVSARGGATPPERGIITVLDFIEKMKDLPIAALMVHGRTLKQGFTGEVDYKLLNRAKKKFKGIFLANGGINNFSDAEIMLKKTGADGLGIGQGACGRPQIFSQLKMKNEKLKIDKKFIFTIARKHAELMRKLKGESGILEMRKHLCWYVKGISGAAELRQEFVKVKTLADIRRIINYK